ncbi:phosphatase PAP2 family protein [Piscinibacter sakaiensis]|uniref:phosphatase PAP2 family protein n=1 Tax=Piscinibacter sakaiensis TaxID=1547922 RepID=UPI000AFD710D
MSWKFVLYDWAGLNLALFQAINAGTPAVLWPLASLFSLIGSYWTAPLTVLGLWAWSKASSDPARVRLVRSRLLHFGVAFLLALAAASALKWWLDFPRPHAVLGAAVHVIGAVELHYSLPSGHATYAALVAAALWPLLAWRGRGCLLMYAALVGWSRMAAGMHFPGDVLAGWGLGLGCTVLSRWLISFATAARAKGLLAPALPWYGVAAAAVAADQAAKLSIERAFVYGKQVEITPFFNLVHVLRVLIQLSGGSRRS